MRASLRVVFPESLAHSIPLYSSGCVLGRREAVGVAPLVHPTVSRRHLRVDWCGTTAAHVIFDLGSHNGSRLNGRQLPAGAGGQQTQLAHGDVLQIGDVIAIYQLEPAEPVDDGPDRVVSAEAVPGQSVAMHRLRQALARAGRDASPVLLVGDIGTGKEQVARELHRLSGRAGPIVTVNCAASSRELIENQLFGHAQGAVTGAVDGQLGPMRSATGGTLFLDEVGDLPLDLQTRLVRAFAEGEVLPVGATTAVRVDVRVIAATSRDLGTIAESGGFDRDLYARLSLCEIAVPPLRERGPDLFGWIARFQRRWLSERPDQTIAPAIQFSPAAAECLLLSHWPENLRSVARLVEDLAHRPGAGWIEVEDLPAWLTCSPSTEEVSATATGEPRVRTRVRRPSPTPDELAEVLRALDGSVRAVARHFGRDRRQIYRWLKAFGLEDHRRGRRGQ